MLSRNLLRGLSLTLLSLAAHGQNLALRGGTIHTMAGEAIEDGVILVQNGKIAAIGPAADVTIPADIRLVNAPVITPGLVDAHSSLGLAGWLNIDHDKDELETSEAMQPELRAIDAYNPREPLIAWVRGFGVTTVHTGHAPGSLISGQTMIVKLRGNSVEDAMVRREAMVAATLGEGAVRDGGEVPGTRSKAVALLRSKLIEAREYAEEIAAADEGEAPKRNLRLEALAATLSGERPLLVTVHRAHDILTALRIAEEFGLKLVLDGASECYLVLEEIQAAGVPVICHPTMKRAFDETENMSMATPRTLKDSGVLFALQSGYEAYVPRSRVILFEAAIAASYGLSFDEALATITINAARLLGIDDRVGSLAVGKDADFALFDGDPFEYTSHCIGTVIEGELVSEEVR